MSMTTNSSAGGFVVDRTPEFQLNDGPNPGTAAIQGALMVFLPDPDSTVAGSEFITSVPAGQPWSVNIRKIDPANVPAAWASVYFQQFATTVNTVWIALDPAIFTNGSAYRVQVFGPDNVLAEEWDFDVFTHNVAGGAADVAAINNAVRRIAGLLGYRQRVTYSDYTQGIPLTTTIEILNAAQAVLATYKNRKTVDAAGHILGETSVAQDVATL